MLFWLLLLVSVVMKHMRDEVWVYSEHSLKTKGLGKTGEAPGGIGAAVTVCPLLETQLTP